MSSFYDDASWLLIPSGIEEDVVFAQKPTSGLGDLTFTRASDATYTDAGGVVRRSPYNLVTWSEMFTDASWVKTSSTITANTISAPNGTLTADTLTASSSFPRVVQNPTIQANQSYRISTYAKAGSASVFTIFVSVNAVTLVNNVQYNLSTGVVTGSGTMQDVGNGWYLCSATFTVGASTASPDIRFFNHAQGVTGGWSGTNFFYAWGAQLVEGSVPLDYFPTTNRQDVPRIDFRNADGTLSSCGRLLLEPQRTNVTLQSETITAATGTTVTLDTTTAPTGLNTADKLVEDTSTGLHFTSFGGVLGGTIDSSVYCVSIFAKAAGRTRFVLFDNAQVAAGATNFDLSNGTVISGTGRIENYGNGWYRCTIFPAKSTSTTANVQIRMIDTGTNTSYTGNGTSGLFLWGKQIEPNATYPTTYIPTTTAAVTRIADSASKTGVSSLIGQMEGTLFVEFTIKRVSDARRILCISDGSISNRVVLAIESSNQFRALITNGGVSQFSSLVSATDGINKLAVSYKANDFSFYLNGVQVSTQLSGSVPLCSDVYLGKIETSSSSLILADGVAQAALFPTRLDNATLAQLTTL